MNMHKKLTTKQIEKLVNKIRKYLTDEQLTCDANIYYNGVREDLYTGKITEEIDVTEYLEYCNAETISITFEGPMYAAINEHSETEKKLNEIVLPSGLYWEQGYAWSMSAYYD